MKIVVNDCFGGFSLSERAKELLAEKGGRLERNDKALVEVVEKLGKLANGDYAALAIIKIPDDVTDWEISEYDGTEEVIYVREGRVYHVIAEDDEEEDDEEEDE